MTGDDYTEADELMARPRLLAAFDELGDAVTYGLRQPIQEQVAEHLRAIGQLIGRTP